MFSRALYVSPFARSPCDLRQPVYHNPWFFGSSNRKGASCKNSERGRVKRKRMEEGSEADVREAAAELVGELVEIKGLLYADADYMEDRADYLFEDGDREGGVDEKERVVLTRRTERTPSDGVGMLDQINNVSTTVCMPPVRRNAQTKCGVLEESMVGFFLGLEKVSFEIGRVQRWIMRCKDIVSYSDGDPYSLSSALLKVAMDCGAVELEEVFKLIVEGENLPILFEKELKVVAACRYYAAVTVIEAAKLLDVVRISTDETVMQNQYIL
ncbi:hypothetical protein ACLOJK_012446 [Asimina triloba]